jgi:hypothetical protein
MPVECLCFEADLGNELSLKQPLEILWVGRFRLGKHTLVNELINRWAFHPGEGCSLYKGEDIVASGLPEA